MPELEAAERLRHHVKLLDVSVLNLQHEQATWDL